jgi:hypothetical protein
MSIGDIVLAMARHGVRVTEADIGEGLALMAMPGRAGVTALVNAAHYLPADVLHHLLPEAFKRRPNRHGWQAAIAGLWIRDSRVVVQTAGERSRLDRWFRYAQFDHVTLPWLVNKVGLAHLPPGRLLVYRGGTGDPGQVAGGHAWSLRREVGAMYARGWRRDFGVPGEPVVVGAYVDRDDVLCAFDTMQAEIVVARVQSWHAEHLKPAEIEARADSVQAEYEAALRDQEAWRAAVLAGGNPLEGWTA